MPKLSQILKSLLFQRDMRPMDLSRKLDIPVATVHRMVTGKSEKPNKAALKAIAEYFNINIHQLTGAEPLFLDDMDESKLTAKNIKHIPLIGWDNLGKFLSGAKVTLEDEVVVVNVSDSTFSLIMPDYSMEPLFQQNSQLIFDQNLSWADRSYVLVYLNDPKTYVFRQLLIDIDHQFIKPLNPELGTTGMRILSVNDKIIARLVESRNKL